MKRILFLLPLALLVVACQDQDPTALMDGPQFAKGPKPTLEPIEALGKAIYFDMDLSLNGNQACASCHEPAWGFTGPGSGVNLQGSVQMGSVTGAFGNRKPPSAAYATQAKELDYNDGDEVWEGGNFWDGRATGWTLGNPTAEQALGPFLNPAEQALPDRICVLHTIAQSKYADLWAEVWGYDLRDLAFPKGLNGACKGKYDVPAYDAIQEKVDIAYDAVGFSIAAFEASPEVNAFSSKFDMLGPPDLAPAGAYTDEEILGWDVFNNKGQCALCHISETDDGSPPLFTDYTYDNLGIPANPLNPVYNLDPGFVDEGLGFFLATVPMYAAMAGDEMGKVKVPTLRNVAKSPGNTVKAFGHNGVFKSLEQIVHFYNTAGTKTSAECPVPVTADDLVAMGTDCWPLPEVADNVNRVELGNLLLTPEEEAALVAFMKTLSDGWTGR